MMENNTQTFESQLNIEVSAEVTHPPGTTFDENGNPIPPEGESDNVE